MDESSVDTQKVYTLLELNSLVRESIKQTFPDLVWVCGEIKDLRDQKKHIYFNLCQKHPEVDKIIAQAKAVIFERTIPYIHRRLSAQGKFVLKKDIEIKILCRVDFYPKWGKFMLVVLDIDPIYTLGKIAQNKERIISKLKELGLLEKNKFLEVSLVPLNIGLITSYDSAAYHDFISELKTSGFGFKVYFYDAYMQGENTERDIIRALKFFSSFDEELDVVVITRGGGSSADLSWFDNFKIAKAVASSRFPVFTALGHEINISVVDYVAHQFFKTPTAIAKDLVGRVKDFWEGIDSLGVKILDLADRSLENWKESLLKDSLHLQNGVFKYFDDLKRNLAASYAHMNSLAISKIRYLEKILEVHSQNFRNGLGPILKEKRRKIESLEEKLEILNPRNILKRGFSITTCKGRTIKDASFLKPRDQLYTFFYKGRARSYVEEITDG